jgi:hypothetical protein
MIALKSAEDMVRNQLLNRHVNLFRSTTSITRSKFKLHISYIIKQMVVIDEARD